MEPGVQPRAPQSLGHLLSAQAAGPEGARAAQKGVNGEARRQSGLRHEQQPGSHVELEEAHLAGAGAGPTPDAPPGAPPTAGPRPGGRGCA